MSSSAPTALIVGVTGQDGAYLAKHLLDLGYVVHGTSRDSGNADTSRLKTLGVAGRVLIHSMNFADREGVSRTILGVGPHEIYHLGGQTSVGWSFEQPVETIQSGVLGILHILETLRLHGLSARVFNACSGECFGELGDSAADESTPFRPASPYAAAKCAGFWITRTYREAYGIKCSSGILFNHESPLRPDRFVTRKVVQAAIRSSKDPSTRVRLGSIDVIRDWGLASEYAPAMHAMLQLDRAEDFVISSGLGMSLEDFVRYAFLKVGRDFRDHVDIDRSLFRPTEIRRSVGNPAKALKLLQWEAKTRGKAVVDALMEQELNKGVVNIDR